MKRALLVTAPAVAFAAMLFTGLATGSVDTHHLPAVSTTTVTSTPYERGTAAEAVGSAGDGSTDTVASDGADGHDVGQPAAEAVPTTTTTTPVSSATTTTVPLAPWCVVYWASPAPISNPAEDNDLSGPDPHGARSMACSDVDGWEAQQPSDWTFTVAPDPGPTS